MSSDSQHDETDSSIEQPVDSTPQMPGLQDIDQLTARELYELSKTVKERNDKAEAEKLQEKKKRTMWKRIERGKGELAALEENLKDARKVAAMQGTWSSIRLEVSENCADLMLDRKWAKKWEIPGMQVLWILRRHMQCSHRGSDKYFRVGSMKQRDYEDCATYFLLYRKPSFLERLLDVS